MRRIYFLTISILGFSLLNSLRAQETDEFSVSGVRENHYTDTLTKKEIKKQIKELRKLEHKYLLKESHSRFIFSLNYVYAILDTRVSFNRPGGIASINIGLEKHLNLPRESFFFSGSFIYRFSMRSGLYASYYGFNRSKTYQTKQDIIWKDDTIPAGTGIEAFFNLRVVSAGYLYSIMTDPRVFLGAYVAVHTMIVKTGIKLDADYASFPLDAYAPLPSVGLIFMFRLNKWFALHGNVGAFSLYVDTLGGYVQNLEVAGVFDITKWMALTLSYQKFFVRALFPDDIIDTTVDYDFKGPAAGLVIHF